jgi:hypothetical protein
MGTTIDPALARRAWRAMETVHGMIYFSPHEAEAYAAVGVTKARPGYFGSRSAAMGPVDAEVVIATFYNFNPSLVRHAMDGVWDVVTPAALIEARYRAVDASLRQAFDDEVLRSGEMADAVELVRRAAEVACERPEGRPLFAAHTTLPWPDEPHLALWHGQTLLREFRGDGHIAALVVEGLSGLDALVSHAASGDVTADALRLTRAFSADEWAAGVASMAERGLVNADGSFTTAGREQRARIESTTDRLAAPAWAVLGEQGCAMLRTIGRQFTELIVTAGLMHVDPNRLLD